MSISLRHKPSYLRGPTSKGFLELKSHVIRDGGDSGAGLIKSFSVITRGEALGHEMWIDKEFLSETASAINDAGERGIKSRFTHPDMSGDGLGRFLGRVKGGRVVGNQIFADLHISELAHATPEGNLAEFVMSMAEKEPDMFGTSIVFRRDIGAEDRFRSDNTDKRGEFKSPDRNNAENMLHARLAELRADDIVDDPAANPQGMFHRGGNFVTDASALLDYAFGLKDAVPELSSLDIDPDRVVAFLERYLDRNGMRIVSADTVLETVRQLEESMPID